MMGDWSRSLIRSTCYSLVEHLQLKAILEKRDFGLRRVGYSFWELEEQVVQVRRDQSP
jgi:hypothetical protein